MTAFKPDFTSVGKHAVHGGRADSLFDNMVGMISQAAGRGRRRSAARPSDVEPQDHPIDCAMAIAGGSTSTEGDKASWRLSCWSWSTRRDRGEVW